MKKEKIAREIRFKVQHSLFEKFEQKCNSEFKTVSAAIRELMRQYLVNSK